ncbi:hypothetical protein DFA_08918 [Cavenderia fasciculata]|uniref:Roc domain-containing protein n=1 Tax=Cavenderia fasciculata TaxID=261658 RepID=F4Q524_CACFS|nr:uncharacterized protein DFA_08918 [Cavenderia fasciculata]EGG17917.1 hypothetical protein DFA_08918 [Cavenderia fasciculata]|eukprot:XP_004356401.1 hypothetical protein DFA_08918 [Cavenderia fasciculata]
MNIIKTTKCVPIVIELGIDAAADQQSVLFEQKFRAALQRQIESNGSPLAHIQGVDIELSFTLEPYKARAATQLPVDGADTPPRYPGKDVINLVPRQNKCQQYSPNESVVAVFYDGVGTQDVIEQKKDFLTTFLFDGSLDDRFDVVAQRVLGHFSNSNLYKIILSKFNAGDTQFIDRIFGLNDLPEEFIQQIDQVGKSIAMDFLISKDKIQISKYNGVLNIMNWLDNVKNSSSSSSTRPHVRLNLQDGGFVLFPEIPLKCWQNLIELDVENNKIKEISPAIKNMKQLKVLNIKNNCLDSFPIELCECPELKIIEFSNNPLFFVPKDSDAFYSTKNLLNFYSNTKKELKTEKWPFFKLMLFGDESSGKTSLLECIKGVKSAEPPAPTKLVSISKYYSKTNKFTFSAWDFSGNTKYRSVHQPLITPNGLYIITFDVTQDNWKDSVEYWLSQVSSVNFNQSDRSPSVFFVGTHTDTVKSDRLKSIENTFKQSLLPGKTSIASSLFFVSSKKEKGISDLKKSIYMEAQKRVTLVNGSHLLFERQLNHFTSTYYANQEDRNVIIVQKIEQMAPKSYVKSALSVINNLNESGIVVYRRPHIFINCEWFINELDTKVILEKDTLNITHVNNFFV